MLSKRPRHVFVQAVAGLLWLPVGTWAQNSQVQGQAATTVAPEVEQRPSGQVAVTYENGQLTVDAQNAPFIDVVHAACDHIGAWFDVPPGFDDPSVNEPISATLGPGPAREVLVTLLKFSRLPFGITGWPDDPNALAQVSIYPMGADAMTADATSHSDRTNDGAPSPVEESPEPLSQEATLKQLASLFAQAKAEMATAAADQDGRQHDTDTGNSEAVASMASVTTREMFNAMESEVSAAIAGKAGRNSFTGGAPTPGAAGSLDAASQPFIRKHRPQ
jgi:hypothetical protein